MFYNHLFWITIAILFCSALNINVYLEFAGTNKNLKKSVGLMGSIGLVAGSIRLIMLSLAYNWWWFVAGMGTFLLGVGIFSYLFRSKIKDVLGVLNLLIIPFLWWYGSQFNTILSTEWFYNLVDSIRSFFA